MSHQIILKRTFAVLGIILLLTAGIAKAQDIQEAEKGVWKTSDTKASLALGKLNRIIIRAASSVSGSLQIETGYVKEAQLVYTKSVKAQSRNRALDFIDALSVSLDAFGGKARLEFRAPNPAPWDGQTEAGMVKGRLLLPKGTLVEIEAASFDVKATGPLSGLIISSSLGQIEASQIDSVLDVSTANQKVLLDRISGDISVSTSNAPLTATRISAVGAPARFKNEGGDIKIDTLVGSINARNSFGRISISEFTVKGDGSTIRGASGPISLAVVEMKKGQLVVSNKLEDIEILVPPTLSAFLSLSVEEDDNIQVTGFKFRTDLVQHNRLNLVTGKGDVNITCSVKGKGGIYVRGVSSE